MIKFSKLLTFITTIILFVGCFNEHYWQFNIALSDVAHISIIYLETHKLTEDIISTPSEKEVNLIYFDEFYNEVENMKMKSRFPDVGRAFLKSKHGFPMQDGRFEN